ncbi:four-helix bundle copper-binding protein [Actinomadura sp. ATCC 31491]|uniref:Four-helix bundle copper-binding protein n=1 Tax=Actinomadura luzonensis TaxID=2805427 RepID=A0ABT0FTM5_9ACTN|nr:four-helix bundle copper-binding protein [Actinomadura luzonensis]MCK2215694.1 four-helix bundle copper-binding protein [Actinomadura luzonensis]
MTYTQQMLDAYPGEINLDRKHLAAVIDALTACAQTCTACADACLSERAEDLPMLTRCIRDDLDCAAICATTAAVLSRHTGYAAALTRAQVQAAIQATKTCGDSCGEHADRHEHCRICARVCRETHDALNALLPALRPASGEEPPSQAAPQQRG